MDKGGGRYEVAVKGLLHGAAHVWIWRRTDQAVEVLLQQRASGKINWPGLLDKSAGGHIFLGEEPEAAARRKARQELGVTLESTALRPIGVEHWRSVIGDTGLTENEHQWVYVAEIDDPTLRLDSKEVIAVHWKDIEDFNADTLDASRLAKYVPYGEAYYQKLCGAIERAAELS